MPGAGSRGKSRGQLIRRQAQNQFVGRRAQLSLFAQNLEKDPESETDPADFLFHVRGVGGVGKSTLLRQWQETARQAGAVTAVVDENDVHGVQQALAELARQLAEQAGPLKEFERAAERYRREQEAVAEPVPTDGSGTTAEGEASVSSRVATQAALGAASLLPGAGVVTAMTNPDTAAQGLDRLRAGARARGRRGRGADSLGVSRAFVAELGRLSQQFPWVVVCFDTWEQTGRSLGAWLRDLVTDVFGPLPVNVMVVLAGRDELAEREWAALRAQVADVPLEVFTEAETRALLAARGVTDQTVVEAVLQLSMGLPLLVELLALARPGAAEDVDAERDVVDRAVERFVQWITDEQERETVVACALAPQLNEDVFAAVAPEGARELWGWLCTQPFVSSRGDFKQYHAVVRASMVRQQRIRSPQRWAGAHVRLTDAHAAWRAEVEDGLQESKRWDDARWRRHRLDETYHQLCANPVGQLPAALEQAVHAAGQDLAILRQWTDTFDLAAKDTADPTLLSWADRLQDATAGEGAAQAFLTALLTRGQLGRTVRVWAHTYRGRHLFDAGRDDEAVAELDRAIALGPGIARAWAFRGDAHRMLGHIDQALSDFTRALDLAPDDAWVLARRGDAHRQADHYDQALSDFTRALDLAPDDAWVLAHRGDAHRQAGRYDQALSDLTAALGLAPADAWALGSRGETHREAGRYDEAVADFKAALYLAPGDAWTLGSRGQSQYEAGRYEEAIADLTGAVGLDPTSSWAFAYRGAAHRMLGHNEQAVADLTAALDLYPADPWTFGQRGEAHRQAGRHEQAVADLTAALDLSPTDTWALEQRGVARRAAEQFSRAREDLEAAAAAEPGNRGYVFEKLMLDTVTEGVAACRDAWAELLAPSTEPPPDDASRFFPLFRVLILEPTTDPTATTEAFLATSPDGDALTDLRLYLSELSALEGELAARACLCGRLITEHTPE